MSCKIVLLSVVILIVNAEYFANLGPTVNCTGPRIRKAYTDLTTQEKQNYINAVLRLKSEIVTIDDTGKNESLYDLFTLMHNENSCSWHSSSFFFPVHRYFLWKFESALQYVARAYGSTFNPPITDPCSITIPYWNWEMNYQDMGKSPVFESKYFGPPPPAAKGDRIGSGPLVSFTCPYLKYVERSFESRYSQTSGVSTLVNDIIKYPDYLSYSQAIYIVHAYPHNYLNQQMASMYSPGDPLFWLHHSNIDRLWAIWQDCYDYEQYSTSDVLPSKVYTPYGSSKCGVSFDINAIMPFYYKKGDTFPFPKDEWPTPHQTYFMGDEGSPGFDGIYYRYGSDFIAEEFIDGTAGRKRDISRRKQNKNKPKPTPSPTPSSSKSSGYCVANTVGWKLVNYGVSDKRRALSMAQDVPSFDDTLEFLEDILIQAELEGLNGTEALEYMTLLECQSTESRDIDPGLMAWITMENGDISWYDRVCDNSSARFCQSYPSHELCTLEDEVAELLLETQNLEIIAGIEGFIIILLLVFGGAYACIRRQQSKKDDAYVKMDKT